jgi:hypothetical protein
MSKSRATDRSVRPTRALCRDFSFTPPGFGYFPVSYRRLPHLRQAQGRLWAAFCRRFAAGAWSMENGRQTLSIGRNYTIEAMLVQAKEI